MSTTSFDQLAADYVRLGLHLQTHDRNPFIYLGDPALRAATQAAPMSLEAIAQGLGVLASATADTECPDGAGRHAALRDRIAAMQMRTGILMGQMPASFEAEVNVMYSITAPPKSEDHFRALAQDLEQVIPGTGPLPDRLTAYRDRFLIAPERIEPAMTEALREARARTRAQMALPEDERITVQMDTEGHFSGFAEYVGGGHTIVHFSKSLPIHADRVIELATHEAYPGHHVQGTLIEAELIGRRGWTEWTLLPLYGAHTVLAEGTANFGVRLSFDRAERIAYDREVVFPIAGLSHRTAEIEDYHRYVDLVEQLNFARNETARGYLYQGWPREQAIQWLMDFGLETRGTATQRLAFIDALRAYVVTYNCGLDWVNERIGAVPRAEQWKRLRILLEQPVIPLRESETA